MALSLIGLGSRIFVCFVFEESALKYRRNTFPSAFISGADWKETMCFKELHWVQKSTGTGDGESPVWARHGLTDQRSGFFRAYELILGRK